jgi:hypothetical protein
MFFLIKAAPNRLHAQRPKWVASSHSLLEDECLDVDAFPPVPKSVRQTQSAMNGRSRMEALLTVVHWFVNFSVSMCACYCYLSKLIVRRKSGNEAVELGEALRNSLDECDGRGALTLQRLCGGINKRKFTS